MRDWKTLMEWVRGVRKESKVAGDKYALHGWREVTEENEKRLRRERCRVWLLNSMARNLGFDKKKARLLNEWRFEFARKVAAGKQPQENKNEVAVREAINTLTLKNITESQLPKA